MQVAVAPVTVNVCVPAAVGIPLPVKTIVCAPVAVNVPEPLNIIPFTAGAVVTLHVPITVTFTFKVIVLAAVRAVPAKYVPAGTAPVQVIVTVAFPPAGTTVILKLQVAVPIVTGKLDVAAETGVPLPVNVIVWAPVAVNVPKPVNIIPLTAGAVEMVHEPIVVTFTFKVTVLDAVSTVPAL